MPEIAEVRVVANTLKKQILNTKIKKVKVMYSGIIVGNKINFASFLEGKTIKDITTCGKWLIFNLGNISLLSHLRMEGKYFYVSSTREIGKHEHIIFSLDNDMDLRYEDVRKFGRMQIVDTDKVYETECIKKLGFEPENKNLTPEYLLEKFKKKKLPIKTVLLDQSIINGLGNIYANEVLFEAKINPFRSANTIKKCEAKKIIDAARKIVTRSFELGGCTIRSYTSGLGVIGHFQDELKVQGREGKPCYVCGKSIKRCKIGGRSTFYCEKCQKN